MNATHRINTCIGNSICGLVRQFVNDSTNIKDYDDGDDNDEEDYEVPTAQIRQWKRS